MNNINPDNLFTDLAAEESENISGGWCGYYGGYGYYRPVAYYYRPYAYYYRPYAYRPCYGYYGGYYGDDDGYDW